MSPIVSIDSRLTTAQRRIIIKDGLSNKEFDQVLEASSLNDLPREEVMYIVTCYILGTKFNQKLLLDLVKIT